MLWKYLSMLPAADARYVISVDMRDAVFQLIPTAWLQAHLNGNRLVFSREGLASANIHQYDRIAVWKTSLEQWYRA